MTWRRSGNSRERTIPAIRAQGLFRFDTRTGDRESCECKTSGDRASCYLELRRRRYPGR